MSPARLALATAAAALSLTAPAVAQTTEPEPLVTKSFFFQCQGAQPATKVQNTLAATVSWTETKPAGSFTGGSGCGFADTSLTGTTPDNSLYDAVFGGTFDERVKTANVELHDLAFGPVLNNVSPTSTFVVRVLVDGVELTPTTGVQVGAPRVVSSTGASSAVRFGMTFKKELPKLEGRTFRIGIKNFFADSAAAWVYGAAEVPAGIEFNPAKLTSPKVTIG